VTDVAVEAVFDSRLYSITEAARELGLHPNTLRKAERARRIPAARRETVSGQRYFSRDEIERLRALFAPIRRRRA